MNEQLENKTAVTPAAEGNATPAAAAPATRSRRYTRRTAPTVHSAASERTRAALAEEVSETFFERNRVLIIAGALIAVIGGMGYYLKSTVKPSVQRAPERMVFIQPLPPPPPPPPPPPKVQPPPPTESKMVPQAQEDKPKEPDKPKEAPQQTLGTNLKGTGSGMAGLGSSGGGGGFGGPSTGGGGSKWGFFAGQVQAKVAEALRKNSRTRSANLSIKVRIWPDTTGRVTRAKLDTSTGDKKLDDIIEKEVLTNLQLQEPPPAGMPMPIVMRLSARRP